MGFTAPTTRSTNFLVTAAIWNAEHVDNFNTAVEHLVVRKTSNQTVTSSTVLVNDTALVLPVAANEIWKFEFSLVYAADAAGDLKVAFTFPASGEIAASTAFRDASATIDLWTWTGSTTPTASQSFTGGGGGVKVYLPISGIFINSGTGGNLTLQWAQQTSSGTATTIFANSTLWAVKLA